MSMQISVDPAALSQEQREAVAGFILAYPSGICSGHAVAEIPAFIHKDTADEKLVELGRSLTLDPEIAALVKDDGEFQASVAFGATAVAGDPVAAAAFGVPTAPLTNGNTCAPSPAIVAPSAPAITAPPPANLGPVSSAAPATTAGVELDKTGLPWDNRIHAESKGKIADGTWRKKRNLDPAVLAQVEAELRQVMGAPAAAPLAPTTAPIAPTPPLAPAAPVTANLPTASTSQPVAAPLPPAAPPAPAAGEVPADARAMFVGLVGRASAAIQGQKVTQAEVNQCCADAGVPALPLLANRLDLVATVAARIDALIASRQ